MILQHLSSKVIVPKSRVGLYKRNVLLNKISLSRNKKVTFISAPAGYGKTTLVGEWIETLNNDKTIKAWINFEKEDNETSLFFQYFFYALQPYLKDVSDEALYVLQQGKLADIKNLLVNAINKIGRSSKLIYLVLDDFHYIHNKEILTLVEFLINHQPDQLRLLLISRSLPQVNLSKISLDGLLNKIDIEDLKLSFKETEELFKHSNKNTLTQKEVYDLWERTEGWVAGLLMEGISVNDNMSFSVLKLNHSGNKNNLIHDYLINEVIKNLKDDFHLFTTVCSLFNSISKSFCKSIFLNKDINHHFDKLVNLNLFLFELDRQKGCYRFHKMFIKTLRSELERYPKEKIERYHLNAAGYYLDEYVKNKNISLLEDAVRHFIKANESKKAIEVLMVHANDLWNQGLFVEMQRILKLLPVSVILKHKPVMLFMILLNLKFSFAPDLHQNWMSICEEEIDKIKDQECKDDLVGQLFAIKAWETTLRGDFVGTQNFSAAALQKLSKDNEIWRTIAASSAADAYAFLGDSVKALEAYSIVASIALKNLNFYQVVYSNIKMIATKYVLAQTYDALSLCDEQIALFNRRKLSHCGVAALTFSFKGLLLFDLNREKEALEYLNKGISRVKDSYDVIAKIWCYVNNLTVYICLGEKEAVNEIYQNLHQIKFEYNVPVLASFLIDSVNLEYWMYTGNFDEVAFWIKRYLSKIIESPANLFSISLLVLVCRYYLNTNQIEAADEILENTLLPYSQNQTSDMDHLKIKLLLSKTYQKKGKRKEAVSELSDAMMIGEKSGFISIFVLFDVSIGLIDELILLKPNLKQQCNKLRKYLVESPIEVEGDSRFVETLSNRELEVLKLISEGCTNKEICNKLHLAIDTIKGHTKRIYAKLGVNSRTRAVAIARKNKLLS